MVVSAGDETVYAPFEGEVAAGTEAVVEVPSDATIRVVWERTDGSSRQRVLAEWSGPDA